MAVFLFFDESGNFDFSVGGTPYLVFGVLTTRSPGPLLRPLSDLRYELLASGVEIEAFHATEDKQAVRNRVFEIIKAARDVAFDALVIEKRKVDPKLYEPSRFYPEFAHTLLKDVLARYRDPQERIVIVTDRLPVSSTRNAVEKAFKTYIRQNFEGRVFSILHHASSSHACLQAADYCTWAVYKKWRDSEVRPYNEMKHLIKGELDVLKSETKGFY